MTMKPIEVVKNTVSHNFIWSEKGDKIIVYFDDTLPNDIVSEKQHLLTAMEGAYYRHELLTEDDLYFHLGDSYRGYLSVAYLFNLNAKEFTF